MMSKYYLYLCSQFSLFSSCFLIYWAGEKNLSLSLSHTQTHRHTHYVDVSGCNVKVCINVTSCNLYPNFQTSMYTTEVHKNTCYYANRYKIRYYMQNYNMESLALYVNRKKL